MVKWVIGLVATIFVILLGGPSAAAVLPPFPEVTAYTYDGHFHSAVSSNTAIERGPPTHEAARALLHDTFDCRSCGVLARLRGGETGNPTTYDESSAVARAASATPTTQDSDRVIYVPFSRVKSLRVAAKGVSGLSDDVVGLATRNITNSGDTVLGHFPGYITKANSKGASYFDIGDAWNGLTPSQRWAANTHFLDTRIAAGDRVLLSVPKGDIRPGSYLAQEVQYLTSNGYRWTNQWSLVPRG